MEKKYFVSRGNCIGHYSDHMFEIFLNIEAAKNAGEIVFNGDYTVWFVNEDGEPEVKQFNPKKKEI